MEKWEDITRDITRDITKDITRDITRDITERDWKNIAEDIVKSEKQLDYIAEELQSRDVEFHHPKDLAEEKSEDKSEKEKKDFKENSKFVEKTENVSEKQPKLVLWKKEQRKEERDTPELSKDTPEFTADKNLN